MKHVSVDINSSDLKACHRIGKLGQRTASKKTIVHFTNRKYCKKALLKTKRFYIRRKNNKVVSIESGHIVIAHLLP